MTSHPLVPCYSAGQAFDSLAEIYDETFTRSLIGRTQRDAVWKVVRRTFTGGEHVLELNCGTGEDALFLAGLGASVVGCDASERMISVARRRREKEAPGSAIRFQVLPIERLEEMVEERQFDGVFSNFSGLNCVADLGGAARQLSIMVKPGGVLLLCLSTRVCLWEASWFLLHGQPKKAFRRWTGHTIAALGDFRVEVQYPTVRTLRKLFSPFFTLRSWTGIGVAVPPSYLEHLALRHAKILDRLKAIDGVLSSWPGARAIGDHMLLSFERTR